MLIGREYIRCLRRAGVDGIFFEWISRQPRTFEELAASQPLWAEWVATSRTASGDMLIALKDCQDEMVRAALAHNPHSPATLMNALQHDASEWVRMGVAGHPNSTARILDAMLSDPSPAVRDAALNNPNRCVAAAMHESAGAPATPDPAPCCGTLQAA